MKSIRFSLFTIFFLLCLSLIVSSCKTENSDDTNLSDIEDISSDNLLIGQWEDSYPSYNSYDGYDGYDCEISVTGIKTSSYGEHKGTLYIKKIDNSSGYIFYQLKSNIEGYDTNNKPYTILSEGKWCATAYSKLSSNSVNFNDAYNTKSPYDFPDTLKECIEKYTIENGYFSSLEISNYTKKQ